VVAPPPNLTVVSGTVLARHPHESLPDWDAVTVAVDRTAPVAGLRDVVGPGLGARQEERTPDAGAERPTLVIAVRRELLGDAAPGRRVTLRVKHTPNGPMAEQHPAPGGLVVDGSAE
jgi:hypothetical protein